MEYTNILRDKIEILSFMGTWKGKTHGFWNITSFNSESNKVDAEKILQEWSF